jgi:DNA-binding transcriptional LysR family regulator
MSKTNISAESGVLDSELLRSFLAVARHGSFSAAAASVFRSQSALSLQIKHLEEIIGQAVFRRHARGVELTEAGEKLRPAAEQVVSLLDSTASELRADPLRGRLRIGIPDEYGDSLLPGVVARFARDHPRVELSVRCALSADFPAALERGEIDLAIHAVETPAAGMQPLRRERTCWAVSRDHAVQTRDPLPVAVFDRACWWRDRALEALERSGRSYRVVFSSESVTGIAAAVSAGVAVGALGENSLRAGFRELTPRDGLPALPDSQLVLQRGPCADTPLAAAMSRELIEAFGG